jgi:hypothetical protein
VKLVAGHPLLDDGHYYVGVYDLLINGQTVAALCVDFSDHTSTGDSWTAYLSQVGGDISETYHPSFGVQYEEQAYLFSLITQPGAERIDIQLLGPLPAAIQPIRPPNTTSTWPRRTTVP